jgi:hypothetical protein
MALPDMELARQGMAKGGWGGHLRSDVAVIVLNILEKKWPQKKS